MDVCHTCRRHVSSISDRTPAGDPLCARCFRIRHGGPPWCATCGKPDYGDVNGGPRRFALDANGWRRCPDHR